MCLKGLGIEFSIDQGKEQELRFWTNLIIHEAATTYCECEQRCVEPLDDFLSYCFSVWTDSGLNQRCWLGPTKRCAD